MATPPDSNDKNKLTNERNLAKPKTVRPDPAPAQPQKAQPTQKAQPAAPANQTPRTGNLANNATGGTRANPAANTTQAQRQATPPAVPAVPGNTKPPAIPATNKAAPPQPATETPATERPAPERPAPAASKATRSERTSRPLTRSEQADNDQKSSARVTSNSQAARPPMQDDRSARRPATRPPERREPRREPRPPMQSRQGRQFRDDPRPRRRMAPPVGAKPVGRYINRPRAAAAPLYRAAPAGGSSWGPLLLGLLLLAVVGWLAIDHYTPRIEQDLTERSQAGLDAAGLGANTTVSTDGRNVTLRGNVPTQQDSDLAEETVAGIFGVRSVDNQLTLGAEAPTAKVEMDSPSLLISSGADGITLSGVVSDQKFADAIEAGAVEQYGEGNVTSEIKIDEGVTNPGWMSAVRGLLPDLSGIDEASLTVDNNALTLTGVAADQEIRDAIGSKAETLLVGQLDVINQIEAPEPVAPSLPAFASVKQTEDQIILNGFMSEQAATDIENAYQNTGKNLVNNISTNELAETPAWVSAFNGSMATMQPVTEGKLTISRSGNIKLQGEVETDDQKQSIGDTVAAAFGEQSTLSNELTVVPPPVVPSMTPFASITHLPAADGGTDKIMVSGLLPKPAAKSLLRSYRAGGAQVLDNITIDERVMEPVWTNALGQALPQLAGIENRAVSTTSSGELVIRGLAETDNARQVAADKVSALFDDSVSLRNDIKVKTPTIVEPAKPTAAEMMAEINLAGINFRSGSSELDNDSVGILNQVVSVLSEYSSATILISGHTDSQGNPDYNFSLSADRANAVQAYITNQGIAADRLQSRGYGPNQPIASNDTAEGRALNRRIEIQLTGE